MTAAKHLWLPFTQMQTFDAADRTFVRGDGCFLIDARRRRVFDAVSSIWTTIHGHCTPRIVEAIAAQASTLDHATLLGASNPRAEELAQLLSDLTALPYVFFASDGASAVEAAIKMAVHFWQHAGEPQRTRFVHLSNAYHGDTAGAMSVSDISIFKSRYGMLTFETRAFDDCGVLEESDVAAVIVEPVVQAAAGMRIVERSGYDALRTMRPLLIVDEIATGFGRTGTMFASAQLDLRADLLCVGKGVTGGALPLSATLASARVYDAFLGAQDELKQFFHGHSYAGNPIACAAAIANIALFEEERTLEHALLVSEALQPHLQRLSQRADVREVRGAGLMIGIELEGDARAVAAQMYDRGHFTRAIGNVVQLVPPLASTAHDVIDFVQTLEDVLARMTA